MSPPRYRYPFSAVVGQDDFKLALLANAVDPAIGGVLAVGERGTAKSTLARSFASLLTAGRAPDGTPGCVSDDAEFAPEFAPFVELPLGATVDRLTGSIDTAKLLAGGGAALAPGLLAAADGGVLYADEVNLLGDHLVDVFLDAAAFGFVRVERDGLSAECNARFVLVGTMNPEEGALRPQLLDRFGLAVSITAPLDLGERTEIVERRIAFERDPESFVQRFEGTEAALRSIVERASLARADVELAAGHLAVVSEVCTRLAVEGLRADLVVARTAVALAALDDRRSTIDRDIETAARLALGHRARTNVADQQWIAPEAIVAAFGEARRDAGSDVGRESGDESGIETVAEGTTPSAPLGAPRTEAGLRSTGRRNVPDPARALDGTGSGPLGRSGRASGGEHPAVDSVGASDAEDLDVIATARAAVTRRILHGSDAEATSAAGGAGSDVMDCAPGEIRSEDLRRRVRSGREANLVLCVVDASSSVLADGRAAELRALLGGLVADARRKRDRIALVVFSGREARLVSPPSRNHSAVLAGLETIEPGGTTPLAEGVRVAHETALRELRRNPELRPIVVLVTDGHANVARSGDAIGEAHEAARALRRDGITMVVIGEPASRARRFARATGAEFHPLNPPDTRRDAAA